MGDRSPVPGREGPEAGEANASPGGTPGKRDGKALTRFPWRSGRQSSIRFCECAYPVQQVLLE